MTSVLNVNAELSADSDKIMNTARRRKIWWSRRDLNPRPPRCERGALPAELLPHCATILQFQRRPEVGAQTISQFGPLQAETDLRCDEPGFIAQVVTHPLELVAIKASPLREFEQRFGKLDFATSPGLAVREQRENVRRQHIAAHNSEVARGLFDWRLLDHPG